MVSKLPSISHSPFSHLPRFAYRMPAAWTWRSEIIYQKRHMNKKRVTVVEQKDFKMATGVAMYLSTLTITQNS